MQWPLDNTRQETSQQVKAEKLKKTHYYHLVFYWQSVTTVYLKLLFVGYFLTTVLNGVSLKKRRREDQRALPLFYWSVFRGYENNNFRLSGWKIQVSGQKNMGYVLWKSNCIRLRTSTCERMPLKQSANFVSSEVESNFLLQFSLLGWFFTVSSWSALLDFEWCQELLCRCEFDIKIFLSHHV